jgi:hypothetical protein
MAKYIVTVEITSVDEYEVEANTPEEAMDDWQHGRFLGSEERNFEAEPVSAMLITTTRKEIPNE